MKNLFLIFCVILFLLSCKQVTPPPDTAKKVKDSTNIALVKDMFKAMENENLEAVKGFYSDSVGIVGPAFNDWYGKEQMVKGMIGMFETSDSIKIDVFAILAETVEEGDLAGDWVLQWSNVSWYEVKAGKKITISYHSTEKIKDGKIIIEGNYWDEWDMYKQLGAELKWPEKKK
jgi:ketosteroid isomerase-like protein